jgi:PAS domain S-box-containing protein
MMEVKCGMLIYSLLIVPVLELDYVNIYAQDITGRRLADEKVKLLAAIVQASDDAIIGKNLDGFITSWNHGAEKIYGYTESEVIGKSVSLLVPPGKEDEMPELLAKVRYGEKIDHYETVRLRKDGRGIQMSLTISPIMDADGKVIAASTIGHDITVRKQAELTIKEQNKQL